MVEKNSSSLSPLPGHGEVSKSVESLVGGYNVSFLMEYPCKIVISHYLQPMYAFEVTMVFPKLVDNHQDYI
jgi:hypothetical protein